MKHLGTPVACRVLGELIAGGYLFPYMHRELLAGMGISGEPLPSQLDDTQWVSWQGTVLIGVPCQASTLSHSLK